MKIPRYYFVLLFLCAIYAATQGTALSTTVKAAPPNILFLLSDDHSYPYLSTYSNTNVRTPNLDRLAAEGIKFHRFFTAAPQCVPSRASLMTGRSPVAARMTRFSAPLPIDEITFPEILRQHAGYYTGVCGRNFHLDGNAKSNPVIGEILQRNSLQTFSKRVDFLNTCGDGEVANQMRTFLDQVPSGKPFFLWANFSDPHHPWNAAAKFRPDPSTLTLPPQWPDLPGVRNQFADYCAEINRLDQTVAGVIAILEERKLLDNTLLVFCGDNGMAFPHGKGSLYDPGSNVPFFVRWPGQISAHRETSALISAEDLAPTLLEAAGLKPHERMSGKSFLPLLKGETFEARKYIFVERGPHGSAPVTVNMSNSGYDLSRAVRSDRYKFIYNCTPWIPYSPVDSAAGPAWKQMQAAHQAGSLEESLGKTYFSLPRPVYELYDLQTDPAELRNLSGQPEVANVEAELREALAEKMILDFDYLPIPAMMTK
jgi:arylsulfatase A-like enzyme